MNITSVQVTYGRKHNLGDYSSAHVEVSIWADVTDDDDLDSTMRVLWNMGKANVKAQLLPLVANHRAKVEEVFLGLPKEFKEVSDGSNSRPD